MAKKSIDGEVFRLGESRSVRRGISWQRMIGLTFSFSFDLIEDGTTSAPFYTCRRKEFGEGRTQT